MSRNLRGYSDLGIVCIGAGTEKDRCDRLTKGWIGPVLNLCGVTQPRISALAMQKALFYLGLEDLKRLVKNLISKEKFFKRINLSPGLNQLLSGINQQISFGMVDTLLSDFIGNLDGVSEKNITQENSNDLKFLVSILKQMTAHLNGNTTFNSPWQSFLSDREESLASKGYLVSKDERMMFVLLNPVSTKNDFTGLRTYIDVIR